MHLGFRRGRTRLHNPEGTLTFEIFNYCTAGNTESSRENVSKTHGLAWLFICLIEMW